MEQFYDGNMELDGEFDTLILLRHRNEQRANVTRLVRILPWMRASILFLGPPVASQSAWRLRSKHAVLEGGQVSPAKLVHCR